MKAPTVLRAFAVQTTVKQKPKLRRFRLTAMISVTFVKGWEVEARGLTSGFTKFCNQLARQLKSGRLILVDRKTGKEDQSWKKLDFDALRDLTVLCGKCGSPIMRLSSGKSHCPCETKRRKKGG